VAIPSQEQETNQRKEENKPLTPAVAVMGQSDSLSGLVVVVEGLEWHEVGLPRACEGDVIGRASGSVKHLPNAVSIAGHFPG